MLTPYSIYNSPDYKKLSILRQLFPHVPILALSATCPPKVLKDLLLTLRMKAIVDSRSTSLVSLSSSNQLSTAELELMGGIANSTDGTVLFTAPLYRKNLHYRILPKPGNAGKVIEAMVEYILKEHKGDSGIVYCLSRKVCIYSLLHSPLLLSFPRIRLLNQLKNHFV